MGRSKSAQCQEWSPSTALSSQISNVRNKALHCSVGVNPILGTKPFSWCQFTDMPTSWIFHETYKCTFHSCLDTCTCAKLTEVSRVHPHNSGTGSVLLHKACKIGSKKMPKTWSQVRSFTKMQVLRPRPTFRCLRYGKVGRAWYLLSREHDVISKLRTNRLRFAYLQSTTRSMLGV